METFMHNQYNDDDYYIVHPEKKHIAKRLSSKNASVPFGKKVEDLPTVKSALDFANKKHGDGHVVKKGRDLFHDKIQYKQLSEETMDQFLNQAPFSAPSDQLSGFAPKREERIIVESNDDDKDDTPRSKGNAFDWRGMVAKKKEEALRNHDKEKTATGTVYKRRDDAKADETDTVPQEKRGRGRPPGKYGSYKKRIKEALEQHSIGVDKASSRLTKEDLELMSEEDISALIENVEQLDELSKKTLGSYIRRAAHDARSKDFFAGVEAERAGPYGSASKSSRQFSNKAKKRQSGIDSATFKLTKEEIERLDELSKKTLGSYYTKASVDSYDHSRKALDAFADGDKEKDDYHFKKMNKREIGKMKAVQKGQLTTNEELTEGHKIGDPVIVTTSQGPKAGVVNDITKTHIGVKHEGTKGLIHYHPEYVKKKVSEELDETLIEGVSWERWERSHSGSKDVKKSNRGQWMVSKHKNGYRYGHKEGEDHITVNGTGKEAAEKGAEWVKEKGHGTAYVLESFTPEEIKSDISFGKIVHSALTTARKP